MNFEEKQEEILQKYRNISLKFIETNKNQLIQIYIQHSKADSEGVLAINISEVESKNNVEVSFIPLDILTDMFLQKIKDRKLVNDSNIIYIFLITPVEEQIIEIDIRSLTN